MQIKLDAEKERLKPKGDCKLMPSWTSREATEQKTSPVSGETLRTKMQRSCTLKNPPGRTLPHRTKPHEAAQPMEAKGMEQADAQSKSRVRPKGE